MITDVSIDPVFGGVLLYFKDGSRVKIDEGRVSSEDGEGYEWVPSEQEIEAIIDEAIQFCKNKEPDEYVLHPAFGWKWRDIVEYLSEVKLSLFR